MGRVIDYAWGRPSVSALQALGTIAVCRYLAYPGPATEGKRLSASEAGVLISNGIAVVSNWEHAGSWAEYSGGFDTGARHATEAARQHTQCGGPPNRPIYFSVDFDATGAQLPVVANYYRGVISVIGLGRTGAYGGYRTIKYLLDQGVIRWAWQTFAWSGGLWEPRAHLRQIKTDVLVDGVACDLNESMTADFGQWGMEGTNVGNPYSSDNADVHGYALTQRLKEYQVHASGTDPGLTTVTNQLTPLFAKLEQYLNNPLTLTDEQIAAIADRIAAHLADRLAKIEAQLAVVRAEVHQLRIATRASAQTMASGLVDPPPPQS